MPRYFGHEFQYGMKGRTLEDIKEVLQERGKPLGVNEIARLVGKPVSTVHKYLRDQKYIIQTEDRKWRLPDTFEDLWSEEHVKAIIESTEVLCDATYYKGLFDEISAGKITRTELLQALSTYDHYLYEIKRMIDFIKRETTIRLDGRK